MLWNEIFFITDTLTAIQECERNKYKYSRHKSKKEITKKVKEIIENGNV